MSSTFVAHNFKQARRTGDVLIAENVNFDGLLLSQRVLNGLKDSGFEIPSPIQLKAIPLGRCGLDLIVQAKSGTGKTCVFSVVALEGLQIDSFALQVLVLAPTREIAIQIQDVIKSIGRAIANLRCHTFIGGMPLSEDKQKLKRCQIAVGTPGRIKQLIECGLMNTESVRMFILDEADKLLEESFQEQINWIYSSLPDNKQMLALSATYPEYLAQHLTAYMRNPTFLRLNISDPALLGIKQFKKIVPYHPLTNKLFENKMQVVVDILSSVNFQQCLMFSNLQTRAQNMADALTSQGWPTACIAGSYDQRDRNEAMAQLKTYKCRVLISTDLTARGIDADKVNLVINLDVPQNHETYLHRIGRAGRFGTFGATVTVVSAGNEEMDLQRIEQKCNTNIKQLPEPIPHSLAKSEGVVLLDDLVSTEQIQTDNTRIKENTTFGQKMRENTTTDTKMKENTTTDRKSEDKGRGQKMRENTTTDTKMKENTTTDRKSEDKGRRGSSDSKLQKDSSHSNGQTDGQEVQRINLISNGHLTENGQIKNSENDNLQTIEKPLLKGDLETRSPETVSKGIEILKNSRLGNKFIPKYIGNGVEISDQNSYPKDKSVREVVSYSELSETFAEDSDKTKCQKKDNKNFQACADVTGKQTKMECRKQTRSKGKFRKPFQVAPIPEFNSHHKSEFNFRTDQTKNKREDKELELETPNSHEKNLNGIEGLPEDTKKSFEERKLKTEKPESFATVSRSVCSANATQNVGLVLGIPDFGEAIGYKRTQKPLSYREVVKDYQSYRERNVSCKGSSDQRTPTITVRPNPVHIDARKMEQLTSNVSKLLNSEFNRASVTKCSVGTQTDDQLTQSSVEITCSVCSTKEPEGLSCKDSQSVLNGEKRFHEDSTKPGDAVESIKELDKFSTIQSPEITIVENNMSFMDNCGKDAKTSSRKNSRDGKGNLVGKKPPEVLKLQKIPNDRFSKAKYDYDSSSGFDNHDSDILFENKPADDDLLDEHLEEYDNYGQENAKNFLKKGSGKCNKNTRKSYHDKSIRQNSTKRLDLWKKCSELYASMRSPCASKHLYHYGNQTVPSASCFTNPYVRYPSLGYPPYPYHYSHVSESKSARKNKMHDSLKMQQDYIRMMLNQ